jgi:hypothetical protein
MPKAKKFSDAEVKKIQKARAKGETIAQLAEAWCAGKGTINKVVHGQGAYAPAQIAA